VYSTNRPKTGHKIATQEEHPIHHSLRHIVFYKL